MSVVREQLREMQAGYGERRLHIAKSVGGLQAGDL